MRARSVLMPSLSFRALFFIFRSCFSLHSSGAKGKERRNCSAESPLYEVFPVIFRQKSCASVFSGHTLPLYTISFLSAFSASSLATMGVLAKEVAATNTKHPIANTLLPLSCLYSCFILGVLRTRSRIALTISNP